jgi:hypothetical protein
MAVLTKCFTSPLCHRLGLPAGLQGYATFTTTARSRGCCRRDNRAFGLKLDYLCMVIYIFIHTSQSQPASP